MTTFRQKFSKDEETKHFLTLPLEIRLLIYGELLLTDGYYKLYGSPVTRMNRPFYPHILQVNRQIHTEAVSMLYEKNIFSVQLGSEEEAEELTRAILCDGKDRHLLGFRYPGLMPAHCFQRLAQIFLYISPNEFLNQNQFEKYLSQITAQLPRLLEVLADDPAPDDSRGNKELDITVETISYLDDHRIGLFQPRISGDRKDTQALLTLKKQMSAQTCSLLDKISKKRKVSIWEDVFTISKDHSVVYHKRKVALEDFGTFR